jgi:hypothetical protein
MNRFKNDYNVELLKFKNKKIPSGFVREMIIKERTKNVNPKNKGNFKRW